MCSIGCSELMPRPHRRRLQLRAFFAWICVSPPVLHPVKAWQYPKFRSWWLTQQAPLQTRYWFVAQRSIYLVRRVMPRSHVRCVHLISNSVEKRCVDSEGVGKLFISAYSRTIITCNAMTPRTKRDSTRGLRAILSQVSRWVRYH